MYCGLTRGSAFELGDKRSFKVIIMQLCDFRADHRSLEHESRFRIQQEAFIIPAVFGRGDCKEIWYR